MNVLINISHPAHVHFFRNSINILKKRGHTVIVSARRKEFTTSLLDFYGIEYTLLTTKGSGLPGLVKELLLQQILLAKILLRQKVDIMLQIGGIFNAPIGRLFNIPTIAISDTENDKKGNLVSFTLSRHILLPTCFDHITGGNWKKQIHYPGYHELAYLSPKYFSDDIKPDDKILVRFVGWGAGHDLGEKWLSDKQKTELVRILKEYGTVHISSEMKLPAELGQYSYQIHPAEIHDFMKNCKLVVGESATMTSEAACLGIPAIFISNTGRGYTTEQDEKYDLIKHFRLSQWNDIVKCVKDYASQDLHTIWQKKRRLMLRDKIDVTAWLVDLIENYPAGINIAKDGNFERYLLTCVD